MNVDVITANLYIGLIASDLSILNWAALSDKRRSLFDFKYINKLLQIFKEVFIAEYLKPREGWQWSSFMGCLFLAGDKKRQRTA